MSCHQHGGTYINPELKHKCTRYYTNQLDSSLPRRTAIIYQNHLPLKGQGSQSFVMITNVNEHRFILKYASTSWKEIENEVKIQNQVYLLTGLAPQVEDFFLCQESQIEEKNGVIVMQTASGSTLSIYIEALIKKLLVDSEWSKSASLFVNVFGQLILINYIINVGIGIIHGDLHDKNIIIDADVVEKLKINRITYIDFGRSQYISEIIQNNKSPDHDHLGTINNIDRINYLLKLDNHNLQMTLANVVEKMLKSIKKFLPNDIVNINNDLFGDQLSAMELIQLISVSRIRLLILQCPDPTTIRTYLITLIICWNIFAGLFTSELPNCDQIISITRKKMVSTWTQILKDMQSCDLIEKKPIREIHKIYQKDIGVFNSYHQVIPLNIFRKYGILVET